MTSRGRLAHGTWRYELTDTDVLWAARMVEGETLSRGARRAEDALAVLWTMTSLFSPAGQRAKYGRPDRFASFAALIRAYSQPVNPRWLEYGLFCRPGGRYHDTDACTPSRMTARARLQRRPWSELDAELQRVVLDWAAGRTRNPVPTAIEFAAHPVAEAFVGRNPGSEVTARIQNTFVATTVSRGWRVLPTVEPPTPTAAAVGAFVLGGVAIGGLLVLAWRAAAAERG